jgi:hypothetical protein
MEPIYPGDLVIPVVCTLLGFFVGMLLLFYMKGAFS